MTDNTNSQKSIPVNQNPITGTSAPSLLNDNRAESLSPEKDLIFAVVALVSGILGFVSGGLFSVVAIIFGQLVRSSSKKQKIEQTTLSIANWGFWLGIVLIGLGILSFVLILLFLFLALVVAAV